MKAVILCCLSLALLAFARADQYTDKYDNIDVQEIVDNERLLDAYAKCVLDKGHCTAEGETLKGNLKEAMETDCEKCTDTQKSKSRIVLKALINKHPAVWSEVVQKYDPTKKYAGKYEAELKE